MRERQRDCAQERKQCSGQSLYFEQDRSWCEVHAWVHRGPSLCLYANVKRDHLHVRQPPEEERNGVEKLEEEEVANKFAAFWGRSSTKALAESCVGSIVTKQHPKCFTMSTVREERGAQSFHGDFGAAVLEANSSPGLITAAALRTKLARLPASVESSSESTLLAYAAPSRSGLSAIQFEPVGDLVLETRIAPRQPKPTQGAVC
jgi:hypothetical protein